MGAACLALALVMGSLGRAHAGPPSASVSDIDPCIVNCPAGDSVFVAIVREGTGEPYDNPGAEALLDLCGCPDVHLAPVAAGGPYSVVGCTARTVTDFESIARFPLAAGGVCDGASIRFICDGYLLSIHTSVASFDQDGDLAVGASDLAMVDAKLGTADPTADFDCDGAVTAGDREIAAAHLGHHQAPIVGVEDGATVGFGARAAPNPTRGPTEFVLCSPARGRATLALFDLSGRRLATLLDREVEPGVQRVAWSGRDVAGRPVATGVYLYRLSLDQRRSQGLLIVTR